MPRYLTILRKKSFLFHIQLIPIILSTGSFTQAVAEDKALDTQSQSSHKKIQPTLELKNGYFFFTDSKMRKIYDSGGWDVQLSGSYPVLEWLEIYSSVEFLEKHGRSEFHKQETSIWEVPLSLGLKPTFAICPSVQYYFTLGLRYCFVHQHNDSSFVDKNISQNGIGGFVNTGFNFILWRHFLIDLFGEYSYVKMRFHTNTRHSHGKSMQVGGCVVGVGLGYAF